MNPAESFEILTGHRIEEYSSWEVVAGTRIQLWDRARLMDDLRRLHSTTRPGGPFEDMRSLLMRTLGPRLTPWVLAHID